VPTWRGSFALLCLLGSASSALAQGPNDFLRTFGMIMQPATVQATQAAWAKVPSDEAACINDALYQQGGSVEALIQRGVLPSDPRLANERSNCQKQSERQETQPTGSQRSAYAVIRLGSQLWSEGARHSSIVGSGRIGNCTPTRSNSSTNNDHQASKRGVRENWPWLRRASARRESSRRGYSHEENPAIGASVISLPPVNRFNESSDLISRHKAARCKAHRCRNPLVCCNRLCAYHFAEIATKTLVVLFF